ncbi:hypothetical protein LTR37_018280 [Vermiconidia calcicola]|uniref:Uncharacterized protein n=1 Tax=Vermiconidia calcicola TaxID=1690605 RepID=A0ACC3MKC6_9PEZI|nr:hypothetical protein LTR37_018280 [Vermiconidia calcicola]
MAPVFASPDIAAVVAAFPPPTPTKEQPGLLRSFSGSNLLNSETVLNRFRKLLETEPKRIKRSDLPSRLGIERFNWLFDCYDGTIHYSKDKQTLVPEPELETIGEDLRDRAERQFVDLPSFATKADISIDSLDAHLAVLRRFSQGSASPSYVASEQCASAMKEKITSIIKDVTSDKIDLSAKFSYVPRAVLVELTEEVVNQDVDPKAKLEDTQKGVVFVPAGFESAQEEQRRAALESTLQTLVDSLKSDGFCELPDDVDADKVCSKYSTQHPESDAPTVLSTSSAARAIVLPPMLDQVLEKLKSDASALAEKRHVENTTIDKQMEKLLIDECSKPNLVSILLHTEHVKHIENALAGRMDERANQERERFEELFQTRIMVPAHLYGIGAEDVQDATLNQHLEEYLYEHFRVEVVPNFVTFARLQGFLTDKARAKDTERLLQASTQAKTFSDIQSTISKFAKKQKLESPADAQIRLVKRQILQQKVKALRKMSRGSDVLQNLIWILLAQRSEGLFMSSGKDTSRMLKQYQLVGDADTAQKSQRWRDLLKAGQENEEELEDMRRLAGEALKQTYRTEIKGGG